MTFWRGQMAVDIAARAPRLMQGTGRAMQVQSRCGGNEVGAAAAAVDHSSHELTCVPGQLLDVDWKLTYQRKAKIDCSAGLSLRNSLPEKAELCGCQGFDVQVSRLTCLDAVMQVWGKWMLVHAHAWLAETVVDSGVSLCVKK